ncbi:hypothetical protein QVD17_03023 [Tagetes erecta]|uniref:Uncharacterized protein n=1 Tax=Tagetes erecta TaxID=13708 RepID=A0AAD8L7M5_TARER|nr:hypothetical protein QVD17_03023 [Tagetes erecta]
MFAILITHALSLQKPLPFSFLIDIFIHILDYNPLQSHVLRIDPTMLGKEGFSFPELNTLQIKRCPTITSFTKKHLIVYPELKVIDTSFVMCDVKGDLNSFKKPRRVGKLEGLIS